MNLEKNRIPANVSTIHLIAICGTGMGALACMLKDLGYAVTGSDQNIYPPMSRFLSEKGIRVIKGYHEENVTHGPDLVVVGNAVSRDNPEVIAMDRMGLFFCSMPQAINVFVVKEKKSILVAGTHGKTTTASLVAWMLHTAHLDASFVIGGILTNFNSNYRLGNGGYIVLEGDEYDTAFFDKGPKFMHYDPFITVLTGIEFDHADIFEDLQHVKRVFKDFLAKLDETSMLYAYQHDDIVSEMIATASSRVSRYGENNGAAWRMEKVSIQPPVTIFDVYQNERYYDRLQTPLVGEHNLDNALAAVAVADQLHIPKAKIREAIRTFKGVKRRQEIRGTKRGIVVIDDFAHHPTAVQKTVQAVKSFYGKRRVIAVFEPRTNTSMRNIFQSVYPDAFTSADLACIRKPSLLEKIPEGERFSSEQLVDDLRARGLTAHYFEDTDSIIEFLTKNTHAGDVVLIMSNGGFDNIHERLLERL